MPAADHSILSMGTQIGVERLGPGTGGASDYALANMTNALAIQGNFNEYRGEGHIFMDTVIMGDEWSSGDVGGPLSFSEIIWALESILKTVTPAVSGLVNTRVYAPNTSGPDAIRTYTMEKGDGGMNEKHDHVFFNDLTITMNRQEATWTGTIMGQQRQFVPTLSAAAAALVPLWTTITPYKKGDLVKKSGAVGTFYYRAANDGTSGAVEPVWAAIDVLSPVDGDIYWRTEYNTLNYVENQLVIPKDIDIFVGTSWSNLQAGGTRLLRAFDYEFNLGGRYNPFFPMNSDVDSFVGIVNGAVDAGVNLRLGADVNDAKRDYRAGPNLDNMRKGDKLWVRAQATGPLISGADYYMLQIDTACEVNGPPTDEDLNGLKLVGWPLRIITDPNATGGPKAIQMTVKNKVALMTPA